MIRGWESLRSGSIEYHAFFIFLRADSRTKTPPEMNIAQSLSNVEAINPHQHLLDIMRIITHELNSPVGNLIETIDLLEGELLQKTYPDREAITTYLKLIEACKIGYASALKRFVEAIQSDGGTYSAAKNEVLSVRKIVDRCHDEFTAKILTKKIDFKSFISGSVPLILYGDSTYLQQIFRNLLSNAIKYTPEGGIVRFSCDKIETDSYQFAISDSGVGIPTDLLTRIFQPGYRIGGHPSPGEGMGLAIVAELVKRLSGSIQVENQSQGTNFVVTLPLRSFLK